LVIQEAGSRRYALGHELVRLGRAAGRADVTDLARPALLRLARETEDTVFVSVREGLEAVCLDRAIGDYPIKTLTLNVGDRRPLGVGAGSLALLAQLPDAEVEEIVAGSATALARYPGFAPTALRELVGRTRQQGYAFNDGRVIPAMSAVGVPVFDAVGQVCAALSVAAIAERMRAPRVRWIAERLQAEAARLGQDIAAPSQTAKLEEMPA
jgi:DNA-binding IclR family transcriptional regulator